MAELENEPIWNTEKESGKVIRWILERAKDLFRDNKELILRNKLLCPIRELQALTMDIVLPSYVELVTALAAMKTVFDFFYKSVDANECERLIHYLIFGRKNGAGMEAKK